MIEIIQTILLIILIDRSFIIRNRYKISIRANKYSGWFIVDLLCQREIGDKYTTDGGRRLIVFRYKK